jgi:predicted O-methyltransferase YrrM
MRVSFRWKRPAPLDLLTPAMQWGRFQTWIAALLKRPELLRHRAWAWEIYEKVRRQIKATEPLGGPSDAKGRFAWHVLHSHRSTPARYLEVGACEGVSTAFVHAILGGEVQITVVDPFAENVEITDAIMRQAFDAFSANMEAIGAKEKVRVLKGSSIDHLPRLIEAGEQFDIIYIDGSHATLDVVLDASLCWRLLTPGGLMIFDDYWYRRPDLGNGFRPKLAIDGFVGAMAHEVAVLDVARQVFLQKKL